MVCRSRFAHVCWLTLAACGADPAANHATSSSAVAQSASLPGAATSSITVAAAAPSPSAPSSSSAAPVLDAKGFTLRGMPALDRPWSSKDYVAAARALEGLPPTSWPRLEDPASGAVFARFVADDNLDAIRNEQLPLDTRLPESIELLASSRKISAMYIAASAQGTPLRREELAWMQLHIHHADAMHELLEAFIKAQDPKDPKYPVRMKGYAQAQDGAAETALGAAMVLSETSTYAASDLTKSCQGVRSPLVKITSRAAPARRAQILAKLEEAAAKDGDAGLRSCLVVLNRAAKASASRASAETPDGG